MHANIPVFGTLVQLSLQLNLGQGKWSAALMCPRREIGKALFLATTEVFTIETILLSLFAFTFLPIPFRSENHPGGNAG